MDSEAELDDKTLWSAQVHALEKLLQFNQEPEVDGIEAPVSWKVLVFDTVGRDIVSSVLRVSDLFKNGVTLHLLLESQRSPIPDVPAIYFVEPTPKNIEIIGKDVASKLYTSFSLNFTRPLSRALLEDLAAKTLHSSASISQVYEQYLQFTVLEPDVFSLSLPDTYRALGDTRSSEHDIESSVNKIVDGLFCMLMTYGVVPVIRASRGNAAEMVAQVLDERLRSFLVNKRGDLPQSLHDKRVILTLIDRNIDLVSMFSHSWTYESLINDTCVFERNSIKTPDGKVYDVDPQDKFWQSNRKLPFPEVADNLDAFVVKYKEDARKITGNGDIDIEDPASVANVDLSQTTSSLKLAMTAIPELSQRKKTIDMHMNIATVLLKAIGDRGLAQLFEAEETASRLSPKQVLEIVKNKELGTPEDKLRLYLTFYVTMHSPPERRLNSSDMEEIERELMQLFSAEDQEKHMHDMRALKYVKRTKEISSMSMAASNPQTPSAASSSTSNTDIFRRFTSSLSDKLNQGSLTEGFGNIISGVRNFLPEKTETPVTRIAQHLLDPQASAGGPTAKLAEDFLYFDPRESRGALSRPPPKRSVYDQTIVFMVGGGNYYEYANVSAKLGNKVIYGATDIPSPHAFISQCAQLGANL
ncbi:syntaxin-binding protein [Starmerella bacillaris]|uniref:Syntaxin-binding protein n=1 Tax=Starmerella bacillaris TaxID=1247836 RepID=A0AAV5RFQ1_STABA|nr:syntaxin-binding protein [Starmerella bacillaris]